MTVREINIPLPLQFEHLLKILSQRSGILCLVEEYHMTTKMCGFPLLAKTR